MSELQYTAEYYGPSGETVVFDRELLTPDLCYDMFDELEAVGAEQSAARIEIERQNLLSYEHKGYDPIFTVGGISRIATMLAYVTAASEYTGEYARLDRLDNFGEVLELTADRVHTETGRGIFSKRMLQRDNLDRFKFCIGEGADIIDVIRNDVDFVYDDDVDAGLVDPEM